jgi:hypothetical protein
MPLVIPLIPLLMGLILIGLYLTAQVWAKAMAELIAAGNQGGILHILTLPLRLIHRVVEPGVNYVVHKLTVSASHYMHPIARWFDGLSEFALGSAVAVGLFAERTALAFERLTTHVLPREIGRAVRPVERKALKALGLAGLTAAALHHLARQLRHLIYHDVLPRIAHFAHAIEVAIPREFGRIETRVKRVETQLSKPTRAWLRRLMFAMLAAGLLGQFVKVLAKKFPWLFCRKVTNVGRRICGLDPDLLNSLIADTLLIAGSISVVQFAGAVNDFTTITTPAIQGFLAETTGLAPQDYLD